MEGTQLAFGEDGTFTRCLKHGYCGGMAHIHQNLLQERGDGNDDFGWDVTTIRYHSVRRGSGFDDHGER